MSIAERKRTNVRFRDVLDSLTVRFANESSPWAMMACEPAAERFKSFKAAQWFCNQVRTRMEADEAAAAHQAERAKPKLIMPGDANWSNP